MKNVRDRDDEEIWKIAYELRMQDDENDTYTRYFFGLIQNLIHQQVFKILLMNVREDMALKWKDKKTFVKLVSGKMLKY